MQNQALIHALEQLTEQQAEVKRLDAIAVEARDRADAARIVAARSVVVRERFMALTTHELRTPLNAIMGYLDLLDIELAASMTEKQKGYFARISRACKHLVGITNDFLDMASGDVGGLKVARHEGAARHVMSEASALVAPQAAARNVTVELSETSERVVYLGDVDRVRQVLVNVLGNAVSFTPVGGRVTVTAARVPEAPAASGLVGGPWCSIRVEDTGPGIPSDKLESRVRTVCTAVVGWSGHPQRHGAGFDGEQAARPPHGRRSDSGKLRSERGRGVHVVVARIHRQRNARSGGGAAIG